MTSPIDDLDARLIDLMAAEPRIGLMEVSRRLDVARGTVQARLTKLTERGVIRGFGPEVDPARIGYPGARLRLPGDHAGTAHRGDRAPRGRARGARGARHQRPARPAVRVVARDTAQLQDIINRLLGTSAVRRSTSYIVLSTQIAHRTGPLVQAAAEAA